MRYSERWGDSIEAAVEYALADLKLTKDQVNITVLEEPSKGFFGIGSKLAKVRVEEKNPKEEQKKQAEVKLEEAKSAVSKSEKIDRKTFVPHEVNIVPTEEDNEPVRREKPSKKNDKKDKKKKNKNNNKEANKQEIQEVKSDVSVEIKHQGLGDKPEGLTPCDNHPAKEFLEKTFKEMNIEVTVTVEASENCVFADVEGKDTGVVIGKRGATLDALQYLTSLVVNKGEEEYIRVIVDAEGYRAKREATLEQLAKRLAEKALSTGKKVRLEPMNPYERKVIHASLQGVPGLNTRSEGDEPYRRVVIEPKKK